MPKPNLAVLTGGPDEPDDGTGGTLDPLLKTREVAEIFGVSMATVLD